MGAPFCSQLPGTQKDILIMHHINLTDRMPFEEHYCQIPPHMYEDVKAHLQEMLDIMLFGSHTAPTLVPLY